MASFGLTSAMSKGPLQLFVIVVFGIVSFGQPHDDVVIKDKIQADVLKSSAEHHIVFPYEVDNEGNFLSHDIHHRTKRSMELPEVHYHIPFKNERFHLELTPNDAMMVSGLEVEWRSGKRTRADRSCHFIGSVRNYNKSSVAISNCRGLAGLIRADKSREFFIEPVLGLDPSDHDDKHPHVIYRRSVGEGLVKNSTEPACGVTVEDAQDRDQFEEEPKEEGQGFYVRRRNRRSVSLMKHVEVLLVADYSMTKYYMDRDLESYLFTLMNMLSLIFKHRSIGSAINVVLVRMIIIDTENEKGLNVTNHARKSLNNFCRWVQKNNPTSDLDPKHADAAVLVTRQDICRNSYKPCETLGLSNMDGMCTAGSECSYNQDTGFTVVYTIAHELGHNLGALHDDDYSSCARLREHIMASNLVVDPSEQLWSKCSKKAMKSFFYKGWGWCLNDQPGIDIQPRLSRRVLPGERFDADSQCKMFFGANSTICSGTETGLCKTLWCVHSSGHCATKHSYGKQSGFPALDGTPCGKTKYEWCLRGKCSRKVVLEEPIDGSWASWSRWGACSRTCGRGVRRRTRKCNSPRPDHGGFYCVGEWKRHSICNVQECPGGEDPIQIQCKKFRTLYVNGKRYDWAAKQNHRNPCELRCIPVLKSGRSRIRKFIQAHDGTPCNHGTRNICIQGKCEHVGCDNKLYSSAREDKCGVCRGDGSTCETKHVAFDQPNGEGYTEALVISAYSRNILIQEASGSPNFLALRSASGDYFLNGNWYIQWSGDYDVAGASGHYTRRHNRETFKMKGPITEDLHVLLLYQGTNTGLKAQYDVKRNRIIKPRYFHWKYSPWESCSVTCGQGLQKREIECVDQENEVVDKSHCKNKYRYTKRLCRRKECPPSWWVGVWHECSKTCGHAVKIRAVLCTQIIVDRRQIIDDKKCVGKKPEVSTVCKQPLCWIVRPWFNCTSLCGPGLQHRLVQCPGNNESLCDPSTKPHTNRTCEGNTCSQWHIGAWGECSASCGNGTQIRSVSCEHHDESMCRREEKPKSSQSCPGVPCPVWRVGEWGKCSVTCGKGLETRNVTCDPGHVNFTCNELEKPVMVRSCLEKRCSGWTVGEWSSCSASCGGGIRERKVVCTFKSCTAATRPKHKESCMIRECPRWLSSEWTECSVSCDEGLQYRNITCSDPTYPCPEGSKPAIVQRCFVPECSIWSFGNWSDCSVSCGSGVQTRSVICNAATQEECEVNIPLTERPCSERPCLIWETGNWSECSTTCGPGIHQRSVWCESDSCNSHDKPNATKLCFNPDCAVWVTGNWEECAVLCGEGVQRRQVYCSDDDESECNALEMPEATRDCFVSRCDAWIVTRWGTCSAKCGVGFTTRNATCIYQDAKNCSNKPDVVKKCEEPPCSKWSTGQWSPCSVTCNRGFQRRIVSCHGGRCLASTKPLSLKQCLMPSCGQWIPGNWSKCSVTCGDGIQMRDTRCSDKNPKECKQNTKPVVKRFCNKLPCPYWSVGEWGSCSLSCGIGTQRRNVTCVGTMCLKLTRPAEQRRCFSGKCPEWVTGEWIPCSRSCGGGFQIRMVYCKGKTSCNKLVKPTSRKRCNDVPCPYWIPDHWSDCSKSCNSGVRTRNVTCNNSHIGDCTKLDKPNTKEKCGEVPCPQWVAGHWTDCSKSCNGGVRSRNVTCNNSRVGDCAKLDKPNTKEKCGEVPCPQWIAGHWTDCSKSCNGGIRTRNVTCNNSHIGVCTKLDKPNTKEKCGEVPCPQWVAGHWTDCSKSCNGGVRSRNVSCNNTNVGECLVGSKPAASQKCGQKPCPEWLVGEWSTCSKTCDGGTQTRSVTCKNSQVGECLTKDKPASSRRCAAIPCPHWSVGEWSKCSKSCDDGTQTRTVTCNNSEVGECPERNKPSSNQTCSKVPCPKWSVGQWSKCSKSCGGGIQTRNISCENDNVGRCKSHIKPSSEQLCSIVPCPEWKVSEWSPCSKSCNGGTRYRSVTCNNSHVGECLTKDKPTTNESCGQIPCPYWIVRPWGQCSKSCNGGLKTRRVWCRNSYVNNCSAADKPRAIKICRKRLCPAWLVGEWSRCSKTCGGGIQTRNISCINDQVGACDVNRKPVDSQKCAQTPCPLWSVGTWSECSKSCNGGMQTRTVTCENGHIGECPNDERPSANQRCKKIPCPKWFPGEWSKCTKSCEGGTQTRSVVCLNSNVGECPENEKPATNQNCAMAPCPRWMVGAWGECSKSCDGGFQTRTVNCNNNNVGECPEKEKPSTNQTCGELPCPKWTIGSWSKCSKTCGSGMKYRTVSCKNSQVGGCVKTEKPRETKVCRKVPCPVWSVGAWSKCSKSCNGGIQTRTVICRNNHVGECFPTERPSSTKKCGELSCPEWSVSEWSKCSKSCDGGIHTRTVICKNSKVGDCLLSSKPSSSEKCHEVPCPKWTVGQWSKCSKSCNGGKQTRTVTCQNKNVGNCSEKDQPTTRQKCGEVPCPYWSIGTWSKCTKSCDGGIKYRNITCINIHVGDCVAAAKPRIQKQCHQRPCPKWNVGQWSACSKSCIGGIRSRNVSCTNRHIGDCLAKVKPIENEKCAEVPCPEWRVKKWSECSRTCNGGIQMRNVTCENIHVGECLAKEKPIDKQKCSEMPCPEWSVGQWSECSKSCNGGIQMRNVTCENIHVGECLAKEKPIDKQKCSEIPCPEWSVGQWSECSKSCNGGIQTRNVTCENIHVGECLAKDKPIDKQKCSEIPCPEWSVGQWSECSRTCNGGIQTRNVTCENIHVGECLAKDKPSDKQNCSEIPCPKWSVGQWSECSKSCNGGIQMRTVTCSNSHVGNCLITDRPGSSRKCNDVPCPVWSVTKWSRCTKSCDGGIQTRTVTCNNSDIGDCLVSDKPSTTKRCGEKPCPVWFAGQWSRCTKSCDGGMQARTVRCLNNHVGDCDVADKPGSTRKCGDIPCPVWFAGGWSKCSKTCNGGIQTRVVSCDNSHVGDCPAKNKPADIKKCALVQCPEWSFTEWSKCSKSCNDGIQTRTVTCKNSNVGACDVAQKPGNTKSCGEVPCPKWSVGEWSDCSKSCNGGTKTRTVTCQNSHVGTCNASSPKPVDTNSCGELPCPKWSVGEWTECSRTCDDGIQLRSVTCQNSQVGECLEQDKPTSNQRCGELSCPKWTVGEWSKCSKSCNGGVQTRNVTCKNNHVGKCPNKDKPDTYQNCAVVPCPEWSVGAWSKCSKSCNDGLQYRTVTCKNDHVGRCSDKDKPNFFQQCSNVPCPEWSVGLWSKCSKSCDGGVQTRTVTCKNRNVGKCPEQSKPASSQTCDEISCPKWIVGNWSQCSKTCGSGERTRNIRCSGGDNLPCGGRKPADSEVCNEIECPVWIVGEWSKCKARRCPKGKRSRLVTCSWKNRRACDRKTRPVSRERCVAECPHWKTSEWSECRGCINGIMTRRVWCEGGNRVCRLNKKPADHKSCKNSSCLVWKAGNWSVCPVSCGGGLRSRIVNCVNRESGDFTRGCERRAKPTTIQACALTECPKSPGDVEPQSQAAECLQASQDTYFCGLLLRPSLNELCLFRGWKRKCCRSCFKINAQRKRKK